LVILWIYICIGEMIVSVWWMFVIV